MLPLTVQKPVEGVHELRKCSVGLNFPLDACGNVFRCLPQPRMKIAIYAGTFVSNKDGAVRALYQLVSSLGNYGHEVAVWSPDISTQRDTAVSVHRLPSVPVPLYPSYRLGFYCPWTGRQIDGFSPDIIHISTPDIAGREFLRHARKRSIPVVSVFHTDFPSYLSYYCLGFAEEMLWNYLVRFYNACDLVLAPNETVRTRLAQKGIRNIGIWSRGVDGEAFAPRHRSGSLRKLWNAEGRSVIVYAGRFVPYKDIHVVMELYRRFMEEGYGDRVRFVMIGSGPEERELRNRMPGAVFTGYLDGRALSEAYASGDIFLFPSTTEAFCNVVFEALASGLPAVVSDIGGCMELVKKSGGGLVARAGNVGEFHAHCLNLLDDRECYRQMRQRGLDFAEGKTWAAVNRSLINRYRDLAGSIPETA